MFNVQINQVVLAAAVKRVLPVVSKRVVQPILAGFKLSATREYENAYGVFEIAGTNLDHWATTRIQATVVAAGEIVVNARAFSEAVKACSSKDKKAVIVITRESSEVIAVFGNGVTQRLEVIGESEDYPQSPECSAPVVSLGAKQLATIIDMKFATASYDVASILGGVNVSINGKLDVCATDGSRLVHFQDSFECNSQVKVNTIIPADGLVLLGKALGKKDGVVVSGKFSMSGDRCEHLQFTDGGSGEHNTSVIVRSIQGEYPRYQELFPAETTAILTYERLPLLNAVKTAAKTNDTNRAVIDGGFIRNPDKSFTACLNYDGESRSGAQLPVICINGNFLADWLETVQSEKVSLELSGSLEPVQKMNPRTGKNESHIPASLKPIILRDNGRRYLLMPVQVA